MSILRARPHPGPATAKVRDPMIPTHDHTDGAEGAFDLWKSVERRFRGHEADHRDVAKPRSDCDAAYVELDWSLTGRDVYRFTAW